MKLCAISTPQQFSFESISNNEEGQSQDHVAICFLHSHVGEAERLSSPHKNHHRSSNFLCCTFDIKSRIHSISFRFCPAADRREFPFAACKWLRDYTKSKTKIVARKLSRNGICDLEAFGEGWRWTRSARHHKELDLQFGPNEYKWNYRHLRKVKKLSKFINWQKFGFESWHENC